MTIILIGLLTLALFLLGLDGSHLGSLREPAR